VETLPRLSARDGPINQDFLMPVSGPFPALHSIFLAIDYDGSIATCSISF
jgi:hypothetical protein